MHIPLVLQSRSIISVNSHWKAKGFANRQSTLLEALCLQALPCQSDVFRPPQKIWSTVQNHSEELMWTQTFHDLVLQLLGDRVEK
jgi:hypothetical protein